MSADFPVLAKKIFKADESIRGLTFGRFDGEVLHFEMRPGVESLNPPGSIGKMDLEVLLPTLRSYFEPHTQHFGPVEYLLVRFEKVSLIYMRHNNIFLIVSMEPGIPVHPVVKKIKLILSETV